MFSAKKERKELLERMKKLEEKVDGTAPKFESFEESMSHIYSLSMIGNLPCDRPSNKKDELNIGLIKELKNLQSKVDSIESSFNRKIGGQLIRFDELRSEIYKVKDIVNEVVDYVYREKEEKDVQ